MLGEPISGESIQVGLEFGPIRVDEFALTPERFRIVNLSVPIRMTYECNFGRKHILGVQKDRSRQNSVNSILQLRQHGQGFSLRRGEVFRLETFEEYLAATERRLGRFRDAFIDPIDTRFGMLLEV
jgi:hypothetical protein